MPDAIAAALLIHGAGGGGWEWNLWRPALEAAGIVVAAPDMQPAARGLASTHLDDYRAQMRDALSPLARPRAVIGASLGGLLAIGLATNVDALVLVNPIPPAPLHAELAPRTWPDIVPWRSQARLAGTRRAMPDSDDASALFAFRHWRDESGAVLREAYAGIDADEIRVPVLCLLSELDGDVPYRAMHGFAQRIGADVECLGGMGHLDPLLGRAAFANAERVASWLSAR